MNFLHNLPSKPNACPYLKFIYIKLEGNDYPARIGPKVRVKETILQYGNLIHIVQYVIRKNNIRTVVNCHIIVELTDKHADKTVHELVFRKLDFI